MILEGTPPVTMKKEARLCDSVERAVNAGGRRLPLVRSRIQ